MQSEQKSDKSTGTSEMQIGFEFIIKVRSKISASPLWQRKNNDLTNK